MNKRQVRLFIYNFFRHIGLYVKPLSNIPFGVDWWHDLEYLLNGQPLELAVDVGANTGQTVDKILKYFPNTRICCFEPTLSSFNQLSEKISTFENVVAQNLALGEEPSLLPMLAKVDDRKNTLTFDVEQGKNNHDEIIDVKVDTLDRFCLAHQINQINLLKIDVEGYEMKVLKGAKQLLASNSIDYILVECDFLKRESQPHGNFVEILNYLQGFQYSVVSFYTAGIDRSGWLWGDALFLNTNNERDGYAVSPHQK